MRNVMFAGFLLGIGSLVGCMSAVDEGCASDAECYAGRLCVDGWCTGEVSSVVNNAANNANNSSNVANNSANNPANNQNSVNNPLNNVANNVNNVGNNGRICIRRRDCDGGQVCTSFEPGNERWQCVEPWRCDANYEIDPAVCTADFICANDEGMPFRQMVCEFGDEDSGVCFCFSEPDGTTYEFEASRASCDPESLMDLANTNCGWRVTDGTF